jgi:hypothetical protein
MNMIYSSLHGGGWWTSMGHIHIRPMDLRRVRQRKDIQMRGFGFRLVRQLLPAQVIAEVKL